MDMHKLDMQQKIAIGVTIMMPLGGMAFEGWGFVDALRVLALACLCLVFALCPGFVLEFCGHRTMAIVLGWIGYTAIAVQLFVFPRIFGMM